MINLAEYRDFMSSASSGFALVVLSIAAGTFSLYQLINSSTAQMLMKKINIQWRGKLWPVLLVGLLLRMVHLDDLLWFDESFTAGLARLDLGNMFTVVLADVHPPTNYLISWLVIRIFGDSEWALRLPAFIAGIALIWLGYRLALALGHNHKVAIVTAWLIAVMPAAIKYANEARQYSLMACLVFAFVIALLERWRWRFALFGVLVAWSHNIGFAYLGVIGLLAVVLDRKWLTPVVVTAGVAALWLPGLLHQSSEIADGFWLTFEPAGILMPLFDMSITGHIPQETALLATGSWFMSVTAALIAARKWVVSRPGAVWLTLFAGVPLFVAFVSLVWHPVYLHRALLPSVLSLMPVMAWFLCKDTFGKWLWRGTTSVGLLVALTGFMNGPSTTAEGLEMQEVCAGADAIYNTGIATHFISTYYLRDVPQYLAPNHSDVGTSLPDHAVDALGFVVADDPRAVGNDVCVLEIITPFRPEPELDFEGVEPVRLAKYGVHYWIRYWRLNGET